MTLEQLKLVIPDKEDFEQLRHLTLFLGQVADARISREFTKEAKSWVKWFTERGLDRPMTRNRRK